MSELVYMDNLILFGNYLDKIDKAINKLKQTLLLLTVQIDIFHFLSIENDKQDKSEILLCQYGLIGKTINGVGVEDRNSKESPAQAMLLGTNNRG